MTSAGLIHCCFWQETTGDQIAWTAATRGDYVRPSGTYASDVTDREWGADHVAAAAGAARRAAALDLPASVMNAVFYLLQTGCQWRMLPRDFPPRSTVYGYFRAWIAPVPPARYPGRQASLTPARVERDIRTFVAR